VDLSHLEAKVDLVAVPVNERHVSVLQKGQICEEGPDERDQRWIENV
jgi:hypothetical protein